MAPSDDRPAALRVLGSVAIEVDGREVPVGGQKPRRLLAALVMQRNAVVSTGQLITVLWGDDVPASAPATLQSYVSRLRRLLPPSARLVGQAPGYRLAVERGVLDVDRFEAALAEATELLEGSPAVALARLDEGLAEWSGPAFAEFGDEWWAQAESARLAELRLHARESRLTALLALGRDERAASEAEALVVEQPWRERPWVAMLVALHRAGRQGDALRLAGEYRSRLRDDLGLDPSPEFVRLESDVATDALHLRPTPPKTPTLTPTPTATPTPERGTGVRLIGRERDQAAVVELCRQRRLVTLLGPGGIGKTQLARGVVVELAGGAAEGQPVTVVELARVRDDGDVIAAVATQLGVQTQQGRSVVESVLDVLGPRSVLLVLDNCEHVLETIAGFAERLLQVCPDVRVLATSREPLGLPLEVVYKVPPLPVPDAGSDHAGHAACPAVALFLERARAANPDVAAGPETVEAVAQLCRHLDGIPLAIELAAARTRSLSPVEIVERLGDRFELLRGSSRVSDPRHRSLRELVDWSYQLLDPDEQELFGRLSIFAGAFDLEAVEQVCGYGPRRQGGVASVLGSLVDKSMVQAFAGPRTTYRLLETLREYGGALAEDERPELVRRHGAWLAEVCARGAVGLHGADERRWLDRFDGLFDDLRLAVRAALDAGDVDAVLGMVVAAREHAFRRLRYELIGWAEAALALEGAAAHPLGAAAWGIVAYGRFVRGEITAAIELGERSLELARVHGTETLGLAERALANACVFRRDLDGAKVAILDLIAVAVASGDEARVAHAHYMGSLCDTSSGGRETSRVYAERAQVAAARCANPTAMAQAAYATGIWLARAHPVEARAELERSEALAREVGNLWFELFARTETLWLRACNGEPGPALAGFAVVISAWHRAGDWANQWLSLRHGLGICHLLGADELAVTIYGALEAAGAVDAFPFEPTAAANLAAMVDDLRERLGDRAFAEAEQQGRSGSTSAVIDRIVAGIAERTASVTPPVVTEPPGGGR